MSIEFVVEEAGCASCAELVREAVGHLGKVESVDVDEHADVAVVRFTPSGEVAQEDVDLVLGEASGGAGHAYRVRPGSWHGLEA